MRIVQRYRYSKGLDLIPIATLPLSSWQYGDTPLHTAARYGHAGIARILISARCATSEQNKVGSHQIHGKTTLSIIN